MAPDRITITMEGVSLVLRNFRGEEGKYNKQGTRNFGVLLDDETAEAMLADDWNVKTFKVREDAEEGETPQAWLPVEAAYDKGRPPRIVMITSRGRTNLTEQEVEILDWADITNVDMIVRSFPWELNGRSGVKAYLQSLYVTVEEDELEKKYAELDSQ